ncbi:hypothetical protein BS50DRAFT_681577 [Corynespora cassiicola Philippines]|uniref:Uncharacterized protein n=1 Tax=Corynespora cassiicola Philippines TaxID=1448308 RepID=A0A2T2N4I8_CORCC|nr:hypothetical protein BS50DRAFT_681577 [Corynespora cassiicola Philippines]
MRASIVVIALFTAVATANPLAKRWTCGGTPPAFSCEPNYPCKDVDAWATCGFNILQECGDPTPSHTVPVSECQGKGFTACEQQHC